MLKREFLPVARALFIVARYLLDNGIAFGSLLLPCSGLMWIGAMHPSQHLPGATPWATTALTIQRVDKIAPTSQRNPRSLTLRRSTALHLSLHATTFLS